MTVDRIPHSHHHPDRGEAANPTDIPERVASAGAIIVAAGQSRRFGVDKLFAPLHGKPVLQWTLEAFLASQSIRTIALVLGETNIDEGKRLLAGLGNPKRVHVARGGARRQDSVAAGLAHLGDCAWVVVHDGARPLVTPSLIEEGLQAARETGAALAAVPVTDTIKVVDANGHLVDTPDRARLWAAQTPQVFRSDLLRHAHHVATRDVTDDATLLERLGHTVVVYPSTRENVKITTPDDLIVAEALLAAREQCLGVSDTAGATG